MHRSHSRGRSNPSLSGLRYHDPIPDRLVLQETRTRGPSGDCTPFGPRSLATIGVLVGTGREGWLGNAGAWWPAVLIVIGGMILLSQRWTTHPAPGAEDARSSDGAP